jgi:uncharacterized PurR-regulated membrane protein YhhQ (DUF165 family)
MTDDADMERRLEQVRRNVIAYAESHSLERFSMSHRLQAVAAFGCYIAAIVLANTLTAHYGLVPVGFGLVATAGTYAAGFALLARDVVQETGGVWIVLVGIAIGGALSWWFATPQLAVASVVAFTLAELADLAVYTPLRRKGFTLAAFASNVVGAIVDTYVFLHIAGFPITHQVVAGQLVCKLLWATVLPLAVIMGVRHLVSRESVRA